MKALNYKSLLFCLVIVASICLTPVLGQAAISQITESEIFAATADIMKKEKAVDKALTFALVEAAKKGMDPVSISAGLAETLMNTGIELGQDGNELASQICCVLLSWLDEQGVSTAGRARALSQAVMGVRGVSEKHGLDNEVLQASLEKAVMDCAGDMGQVMTRVVGTAFQEEKAETYTPFGYTFLAQAAASMREAEKSLDDIVGTTFSAAEKEGLSSVEIASGLSETLMKTGMSMGQDGADLGGQICCATIRWLDNQGATSPQTARTLSQTVMGIRNAAALEGLDNQLLQSRLENAVMACAGDSGPIMARIVGSAFGGAETFTPPVPTGPEIPGEISDSFDFGASS